MTVNTPEARDTQPRTEQAESAQPSGKQSPQSALRLDFHSDPVALTAALVDIASPSHHEDTIADAIEMALIDVQKQAAVDIEVQRYNNTVCAKTNAGFDTRVVLAGHVDTVPIADNVPHSIAHDAAGQLVMHGCGTTDMKSGLAVYLHVFAQLVHHGNPVSYTHLTLPTICSV